MNLEDVGRRIKELRIKNNLSQSDLAKKIIISPQAISKWERGVSLPDVVTLQQLSELFDVSISYILTGENKSYDSSIIPKKNNWWKLVILFIIAAGIILFVMFNKNDNFHFDVISTTCKDFKITGSAAYNKDKTSLYISDINYCSDEDKTEYKEINCILYESYADTEVKINTCDIGKNQTLNGYLEDLKINVNDYNFNCRNFANSKLYLEINAIDINDKLTVYRIPISLGSKCNN